MADKYLYWGRGGSTVPPPRRLRCPQLFGRMGRVRRRRGIPMLTATIPVSHPPHSPGPFLRPRGLTRPGGGAGGIGPAKLPDGSPRTIGREPRPPSPIESCLMRGINKGVMRVGSSSLFSRQHPFFGRRTLDPPWGSEERLWLLLLSPPSYSNGLDDPTRPEHYMSDGR